ncbi:PAS domain S-box protein, partial [Azospirillum sp.]|uniref:PAS domain S-box protein n=1 Tax=Azospirillum sp. TaxID=34012 RepID=UPI002D621B17
EAALRESEERFRAMADSAPSPVWVSGPEGGIDFGNQAMLDFFGEDAEGILGDGWTRRIHPDDLAGAMAVRESHRPRNEPFGFEARFLDAAGEWRWMRANTRPRFDADGRFLGYVGMAFDITQAREAEAALRADEQRHAFLLQLGDTIRELEDPMAIMATATRMLGQHLNVPRVGYGEVDETETTVDMGAIWTDGTVQTAAGVYRMDDFGPRLSRDLKARKTVRVSDVTADPRTAGAAAAAFHAMQTSAFLRVPISRAGHLTAFLFLHSPTPRQWTDDEAELAEDVADRTWAAVERARAEIEVRESEARFRSIADSAPVLIWVTRADRRRAFVNQAYVEFYGGTYEEARDADWREKLHPDDVDRIRAESLAGEATRQPFMLEARYLRHDGEYRWLRSYSRPRLDKQGGLMGFVGVAYDVTEAHQVETDLKRINELLEERVTEALTEKARAEAALMHAQRMEAVGRLTGGVAHDFNNLLMAVLGNLELLRKRLPADPTTERLFDGAMQGARRGATLTQRLLAFARRQDLQPQAVDLAGLLDGMKTLLERSVGPRVVIRIDAPRATAPALIDPNQLELAILNLAVNARDAMPDGGTLTVTVDEAPVSVASGLPPGFYPHVSVRDTGTGMDGETLARAVEPFFSTKGIGKGTGLGLSMVHGLAVQSGGAFRLSSVPGQGTVVELWLPKATTPVQATELPPAPVVDVSPAVVLVVDDDALIAMSTVDMLADLGHTVLEASSGTEALELLRSGQAVDLMLTDYAMPGMTGVELARAARAMAPDLPVLLATGYADLPEGVVADLPRLAKPYTQNQLAVATAKLLAEMARTSAHAKRSGGFHPD